MGSSSAGPTSFSPSSQISWYARVFGLRCSDSFFAPVVHLLVQLALDRVGAGHDIAIHVAAGGDGIDERGVHRLHGLLQILLDHAVHLESLARGQAQRPGGVGAGELRQRQPLLRRHHAAGQARADHEAVGRLELLVFAFGAQVAIVLHVAAVELDELRVGLADGAGQRIRQALDQRAAQAARRLLDDFDGRRRVGLRRLRRSCGAIENFSRHRANTVRQR